MRSIHFLAALAAMGLITVSTRRAGAASPPTASGTVTTTGTGALNTYALSLIDSGSSPSPIGSVWAAWVPGQFYLTSDPTSVTAPTGWTSNVTPGGGGYGIQWVASSSSFDVPIGGSLSGFGFQSPDSPANIDGNSTVVPGTPTLTSVAYDAGLFSDSGTTFVFTPTSVPEPTSLALLAPAALMMLRRSRRSS
jgi:hypothetical protein